MTLQTLKNFFILTGVINPATPIGCLINKNSLVDDGLWAISPYKLYN